MQKINKTSSYSISKIFFKVVLYSLTLFILPENYVLACKDCPSSISCLSSSTSDCNCGNTKGNNGWGGCSACQNSGDPTQCSQSQTASACDSGNGDYFRNCSKP